MDLAKTLGADVALTLMAVMVTGISGVLFGPPLLKLFKVEDPILQGISMGTSSHVIGTSRAMEMGPVQGAISSVAIFVTGIATVVLTLLVF
jgi:putative effector of murein hydrolase